MEARHWLGFGLFSLCVGTGFVDMKSNSVLVLLTVFLLGISLMLPQRWHWAAFAFWGGLFATFGTYIYVAGIEDAAVITAVILAISGGLVYQAARSAREALVLAKLNVWGPWQPPTAQEIISRIRRKLWACWVTGPWESWKMTAEQVTALSQQLRWRRSGGFSPSQR